MSEPNQLPSDDVEAIEKLRDTYAKLSKELGKVIVAIPLGYRPLGMMLS